MACDPQSERVPTISYEVGSPFLSSHCICIFKETQKITSHVFYYENCKSPFTALKIAFYGKHKIAFHSKQIKFSFHGIQIQIKSLLNTCAMKVKKKKKFIFFSTSKSFFMDHRLVFSNRIENLAYPYTKENATVRSSRATKGLDHVDSDIS